MGTSPDPLGWLGSVLESKYRLDAFVGEGGFGYVYRGTHLRLGKPIAVKFLRPELASGHERQRKFLVRFLAEGRILHDLSRATAGVVQALDLGAAVSPRGLWTPFIVMEWMEGRTLADELRATPKRSVGEAIALLDPLLAALEIAHELGISHLDLKPANVMRTRIGTRETMKALDFGISKAVGSAEDAVGPGKSGIGTRVFTPAYGAPEQFDPGLGQTGPWTDVYAVGLMLIEIVDGVRPYGTVDPLMCRRRALDLEVRPELRDDRSIDELMQRVLAVDPRNRPMDATALRKALEPYAGLARDSGSSANGPQGVESPRTEPLAVEPRSKWAPIVAATLGLGAVGASLGWWLTRTPEAPTVIPLPVPAPSATPDASRGLPPTFLAWLAAERSQDPNAEIRLMVDSPCYYGFVYDAATVRAKLAGLYNGGYSQSINLEDASVESLDASSHRIRVEFRKTFALLRDASLNPIENATHSVTGFVEIENGQIVWVGDDYNPDVGRRRCR